MVAQLIRNQQVVGSSPISSSKIGKICFNLAYFTYTKEMHKQMNFINAVVFTDKFEKINISVSNGKFSGDSSGETIDLNGKYIIPGLIDIHTHGAVGTDTGSKDFDFKKWQNYLYSYGVTTFFPTTASMHMKDLRTVYKALGENDEIIGINLEGPYINKEKRGAHDAATLRPASMDEFDELYALSNGKIKLTTIAPEIDGNTEFIKNVTEKYGITVSLGHSVSDFETAKKAIDCGARQLTHTFNAMNQMLHRSPGLIGAAVLNENVNCEIISDGIHVDPAMVKILYNLVGEDRLILVSDSMSATGLADGAYTLSGLDVTVENNIARTSDGALAGSTHNLMQMLRYAVSFGIPKESAIKAATINPAKAVEIDSFLGSIKKGKNADFIICDEDFSIYSVYKNGVSVYEKK